MENSENSFETKEETLAFLHEMLEWLGPAKKKIENTSCRDFTIGQTLALANIMNGLQYLENGLNELDRIADA